MIEWPQFQPKKKSERFVRLIHCSGRKDSTINTRVGLTEEETTKLFSVARKQSTSRVTFALSDDY